MSDNGNTTVTVGPSGLTILTIVFVLLKVYGKIDWSWFWVFSPIWLPIVIVLSFLLIGLIIMMLYNVSTRK